MILLPAFDLLGIADLFSPTDLWPRSVNNTFSSNSSFLHFKTRVPILSDSFKHHSDFKRHWSLQAAYSQTHSRVYHSSMHQQASTISLYLRPLVTNSAVSKRIEYKKKIQLLHIVTSTYLPLYPPSNLVCQTSRHDYQTIIILFQYCRRSHSVTSSAPQCIPWQLQESHVWRYPIAPQSPQGCRALQTDWRLSLHTLVHMSSPSASQDETQCGCILEAFWTWYEAWV